MSLREFSRWTSHMVSTSTCRTPLCFRSSRYTCVRGGLTCRWQTGCRRDPLWPWALGPPVSVWDPARAGGSWSSWQTHGSPQGWCIPRQCLPAAALKREIWTECEPMLHSAVFNQNCALVLTVGTGISRATWTNIQRLSSNNTLYMEKRPTVSMTKFYNIKNSVKASYFPCFINIICQDYSLLI